MMRGRPLVGAALIAGALIMGSTVSAHATSSPPFEASSVVQQQIEVSATGGWQGSIWVPADTSRITIQAPSVGQYWTVDYRPEANLQYVGAQGHPGKVWGGNTTCKADPRWQYGALLYRLGGSTGVAAGSKQILSPSEGYLEFSINDLEQCQGDNAGSLPVTVILE